MIVSDGACMLLGHAARSPRWDIPKGLAEPGESDVAAALRELAEETGLEARERELAALGRHDYLPGKALALFALRRAPLPDPATLRCRASVPLPSGALLPEFDRFGLFAWDEALKRVGRSLARVLAGLGEAAAYGSASALG